MSATYRPGKLSPRLTAEILAYDPRLAYETRIDAIRSLTRWKGFNTFNHLRDLPPGVDPTDVHDRPRFEHVCQHEWKTKFAQTSAPSSTDQARTGVPWNVAAICHNCHWHLDVQVEFLPLHADQQDYCPSMQAPLHHLALISPMRPSSRDGKVEEYHYRCTMCPTMVHIEYHPPRLSPEDMMLLTDRPLLEQRYHKALLSEAHREGMQPQHPINVVEALATYLRDSTSADPSKTTRPIPLMNKRWLLSFGDDCDELVERLGFTKSADRQFIALPQVPAEGSADPEGKRTTLLDAREELLSIISSNIFSDEDRANLKFVGLGDLQSNPKPTYLINRMLGRVGYERTAKTRGYDEDDDLPYAALGCLQDFADDLVSFAFDRQTVCDRQHAPYYLDCLATIANDRDSDSLQIRVAEMKSQGAYGRSEISQAYRYFNIDPEDAAQMSDEHILGIFQSRLESEPRHREQELREQLRIIGESRGSAALQDSASNTIQNADQAYRYLLTNLDDTTELNDEFVVALLTAKKSEDPANVTTCCCAAEILAEARNSDAIRAWLTNESNENAEMSEDPVATAYQFFRINDRSAPLDLDLLKQHVVLDFSESEEARKHFEVLSQHTKGQNAFESKPDYDNPVGLQNQGNTCYLNSLLQYLFAIQHYRDIILNFDQYKYDITEGASANRRVSGLIVTRHHVEKSQEFVDELRKLFQDMAHAPGPSVCPAWKLACLALKGDNSLPRRSTVSDDRPPILIKKDSALGKEQSHETIQELPDEENSPASATESVTVLPDTSSDTTLVDEIIVTPESEDANKDQDLANTDNVQREADAANSDEKSSKEDGAKSNDVVSEGPKQPDRPPPIPPRPKPHPDQVKTNNWREEAENAAQQQDVTEVIDNVLFKTECAIKPSSLNGDGEQHDQIKSIFYGTQKWTYLDKGIEDKEELFSTQSLTLATQPKDVYEALHENFDLGQVEFNGKGVRRFGTITHPPPVLQLVFQRQDFDTTKNEATVIKHHVELNETLYLDRFLPDPDESVMPKREAYWRAKDQYKRYAEQRGNHKVPELEADDVDALLATYEIIDQLPAKSDTSENGKKAADVDLREELELPDDWDETTKTLASSIAEKRKAQIEVLEEQMQKARAEMDATFADPKYQKVRYDLAAVFVHRGQGGSKGGHYWIYIRDFENNLWRCYNDSDVKVVSDPKEIFELRDPAKTGAPYLVVYVAEEERERFHPLFRAALEGEQTIDIEMKDVNTQGDTQADWNGESSMRDMSMHDASFVGPGEASSVSHIV